MAHFISQTVDAARGEGERGEQVSRVEEMLYTKGMLPHGLLLFAAASVVAVVVVVVVVAAATEPALCIVAISAAGAFFYIIANGRHCRGRGRDGLHLVACHCGMCDN